MGKREKNGKAVMSQRQKQQEEEEEANVVHFISSDEDEGNEDLSLKIVEKSLLRACQAPNLADDAAPTKLNDDKNKKKKKNNNKKKQIHKLEEVEVVDISDKDGADIAKSVESSEKDPAEKSDSLVLRKLLRGPRYFDPPDSGSGWGACYNCGEEGHTSANCTSARRKRPCFICGSLEHHVKQCTKGQDCYICQKGGHRAKDCPENYKGASKFWKICLRCGDSGHHDMFSCKNYYSPEDLKGIQCYICRSFGHLCCAGFTDTSPRELSCYRCGQLGHSGLDCGKSHTEKTIVRSHAKCYECQEVGHFAKNCPSSIKDCRRSLSEKTNVRSPGKCHGCGEEGHIARDCPRSTKDIGGSHSKICFTCGKGGHISRECLRLNEVGKRNLEFSTPTQKFSRERVKYKKVKSATSENSRAPKRKNAEFVENQSPTPYSLKKRGGWVTEDPTVLSHREAQVPQWDSPMTPIYSKNIDHMSRVNGRELCIDDSRYESIASYRRGPSSEPYGQYRNGPSSEPYCQYRDVPSNESYHQYGHAPPDRRPYFQGEVVPSSRPNHRYVVSPPDLPYRAYPDTPSNGPSSSSRVAQPHHPYGPSLSHEAARAHHQSYMSSGSPSFFQQRYSTRFHN